MAIEKLNLSKLPKDISNIERALKGDTVALALFTTPEGAINIPKSLADGKGLTLLRQDSGSWIWFYRYRINGRASKMSLGAYPLTTLAMARQAHKEAYLLVEQGIDPADNRKQTKEQSKIEATNTFKQVSKLWWDNWKIGKGIADKHAQSTWRRLENDVFPKLGNKSIHTITLKDIAPVLKTIEERAPVLADKAWVACGQVFRHACALGIIAANPLANIKRGDLLAGNHRVEHQRRISINEMPELLRAIDTYEGVLARLGLQLMALTFVRHGELRGARWSEFDFETKLWTIPAERMKMPTPHIVPLSKQAIAIIEQLKLINGHRTHLFPSTKGEDKVMSDGTLNKALHIMGYKDRMTVHGFRGVASTELHEMGYPHEHIELQLAHMERNKVSAAYNHAKYVPQRKKMMQDWADCLERLRTLIKVNNLIQA